MINNNLIVITGPTGVGKTDLSIEAAKHLNTEIISCDSRQIFKEMTIGTAVPPEHQLSAVKHHFIQSISIHDYYNASIYETEVINLLRELFKKHSSVIMTGGSGLYIDAVCNGIDELPTIDPELRNKFQKQLEVEGLEKLTLLLKELDPDYYNKVDLNNPKRVLKGIEVSTMTGKPYSSFLTKPKKKREFNILKIGLNRDRDELYEKINKRVDIMVEEGLVEEAKSLYHFKGCNALNTVGYKEIFKHFDGEISLEESIQEIKNHTRKYARQQITWFRKYDDMTWFSQEKKQEIIDYIDNKLL